MIPTEPGTWFMAKVLDTECAVVVTPRFRLDPDAPSGARACYAASAVADGQQFLVTAEAIDASTVEPVRGLWTIPALADTHVAARRAARTTTEETPCP